MIYIKVFLFLLYSFAFVSCDTSSLEQAKATLSSTSTTFSLGESIRLDATNSVYSKLSWSMNGKSLESCSDQEICEIQARKAGEHVFRLDAAFTPTASPGVDNPLSPEELTETHDSAVITVTVLEADQAADSKHTPAASPHSTTSKQTTQETSAKKPSIILPSPLEMSAVHINATSTKNRMGELGDAYHFDGHDDYIRGVWNQEFLNEVTLLTWFKTSGGGEGNPRLVEFSDYTGSYEASTAIGISKSGNLRAWTTCEVPQERIAQLKTQNHSYADNYWHLAVYVYNELEGGKLYIDGVEVASAPSNGCDDLYDGSTFVYGAYYQNESHTFHGSIDSPRIYDVALTHAEILELYHRETPNEIYEAPSTPEIPEEISLQPWSEYSKMTTDQNGTENAAYLLNGVSDRIRGSLDHKIGSSITLMSWFKVRGTGGKNPRIIEFSELGGSATQSSAIAYKQGMLRAWATCQSTGQRVGRVNHKTNADLDTRWYHVSYVYDGSYGYLYLDGALLKTSKEEPCNDLYDAKTFSIGSYYPNLNHGFNGLIAHPRFYHGVMGLIDILRIYSGERSQ